MPRIIDVLTDEERALSAKVRGLRQAARQLEGDVDRLSQRRKELEGVLDGLVVAQANAARDPPRLKMDYVSIRDTLGITDPGPSNVPGHPPTDRTPPRTPHQASMRKALGLQD